MDYLELRHALISKGEAEEDDTGDHTFFFVEIDGHIVRATKLSHGVRGQIDPSLLSLISRQMGLTNRQLREFVSCSIDRDRWMELRRQRA